MFMFKRAFSMAPVARAGHSKWANIKHRKARQDALTSSMNTKIANMIYVAAKEGGGPDVENNVRLATVIENAMKQNVPKKVIEGAVARAAKSTNGPGEGAQSITYEGIGPAGTALIVETLTENKNRTAQQVRAAFMKYKGSLSPTAYMFERRGFLELKAGDHKFDDVLEKCIEIEGVEDVVDKEEEGIVVYTAPSDLGKCAKSIKELYSIGDMGLIFEPQADQEVKMDDLSAETRTQIQKLLNDLDDLDDVSNVYSNII